MGFREQVAGWIRSAWWGYVRSFVEAAQRNMNQTKPPQAASSRGAYDVFSSGLGQRGGWLERAIYREKFYDIYKAILTDPIFLRATFLYEQLSKQGGVTLRPADGYNISQAKARRALKETQDFLDRIITPYGEGWEELLFCSIGELARFSNYAIERVWDGSELVNIDLLPWISMNLERDKRGIPLGWVQFDFYLKQIHFDLHEVGHGYIYRIPGDPYGTPMLEPAAGETGDLRAYRGVEDLMTQQAEHLVYPDVIYNFGTPEHPTYDDTKMKEYEDLVNKMPREGRIVAPGNASAQAIRAEGMDLSWLLKYWQKRATIATGFSLVRLGIGEEVNVATADVLSAVESQNVRAVSLCGCAAFRQNVIVPFLAGRGIPDKYAPFLIPGEPDPVRRQKSGKHAAEIFEKGVIDRDEARTANGYEPDEQNNHAQAKDKKNPKKEPKEEPDEEPGSNEPEERREKRQEDRKK